MVKKKASLVRPSWGEEDAVYSIENFAYAIRLVAVRLKMRENIQHDFGDKIEGE
jgi:hypothetical protein